MATTKTEGTAQSQAGVVGRQELTRRIAQRTQLSQKDTAAVFEAALDEIREALAQGQEIRLVGFGSFKVRTSAARKGVNPANRTPIVIPAKERVRFSPGKELEEAVVKKA